MAKIRIQTKDGEYNGVWVSDTVQTCRLPGVDELCYYDPLDPVGDFRRATWDAIDSGETIFQSASCSHFVADNDHIAWVDDPELGSIMAYHINAQDYPLAAARTMVDRPGFTPTDHQMMVLWAAFGLFDEAGEVAGLIKKGIFHQHGLDRVKMLDELGDTMWYLVNLASLMGFTLEQVMGHNIYKTHRRYPDGFTPEASMNRTF